MTRRKDEAQATRIIEIASRSPGTLTIRQIAIRAGSTDRQVRRVLAAEGLPYKPANPGWARRANRDNR